MLTILSRIPTDIINYVRANELFLLSMFLIVQGEIRLPFFGDFIGKKETICEPSRPLPHQDFYKDPRF